MSTRNRINRPAADQSERIYTRAGEGPSVSPFADYSDDKKKTLLADMKRQDAEFAAERRAHDAAIRHGVKSERDTQPVQVRMLKSQIKVLKQVAEQEDRSTSDVIRELVDAYIAHCLETWEEGPRLDILRATLRAEQYEPTYRVRADNKP
jgi:hypothetical protein